MDFRWYVVRVASNREDRVRDNLLARVKAQGMQEKIRSALVPTEKVTEIKGGRKKVLQRKLYPGYIIVEMVLDEDSWYMVRGTAGIGDFVGAEQMPVPMEHHEVEKLLGGIEAQKEKPQVKIDVKVGDRVKVKDGAFENFSGIVDDVNTQKGLVRVILTIFGRETPVELEYWQIEPT